MCVCKCAYIYVCVCIDISPYIHLLCSVFLEVTPWGKLCTSSYCIYFAKFCLVFSSCSFCLSGGRAADFLPDKWCDCRSCGELEGKAGGLSPVASFHVLKRTCFVFCIVLLALGTNPAQPFAGAVAQCRWACLCICYWYRSTAQEGVW